MTRYAICGRGRRHAPAQGLDLDPRVEVDIIRKPPVFSLELTCIPSVELLLLLY